MLREIVISRIQDGVHFRRWYQDERMDLFVWFNDEDDIVRFQLAYDKPRSEKAIDWKHDRGFTHSRIDDSTDPSHHPGSPLMISGGVFAKKRVIAEFRERATNIEPRVATFVLATLIAYRDEHRRMRVNKTLMVTGALIGGLLLLWRLWK